MAGVSNAPRWTADYSDNDLAEIANDDSPWWSGLHRRQAGRELARRRALPDPAPGDEG